jgi:hypothetical protein
MNKPDYYSNCVDSLGELSLTPIMDLQQEIDANLWKTLDIVGFVAMRDWEPGRGSEGRQGLSGASREERSCARRTRVKG